ncbi:hypothetical protein [Marivita sp.]|uniref:hypothetical protein n=1 Tax=Marivita sp. TaxID=2003365 RepID=UPI0025C4E73B|nr:hypothetical protein [Marivita sp.]
MKRMMIATALATTLGTAGFAATEAQIEQVESFASGIDTSSYTDSDFDIAYGIVNSGMSRGEKVAKLRALETEDNVDLGVVMISEAEMERLEQYAPGVDFGTITQAQAESALAVTYGGESPSIVTQRVQNILSGNEMDEETLAMVSQGEMNMLSTYISEDDIALLTEDELELALSYAYSGMSRSQKVQQIEALINS